MTSCLHVGFTSTQKLESEIKTFHVNFTEISSRTFTLNFNLLVMAFPPTFRTYFYSRNWVSRKISKLNFNLLVVNTHISLEYTSIAKTDINTKIFTD